MHHATARKRVAVIGAGISGVCSAAHLLSYGLDVTVFERSSVAGGVWHFDECVAEDPPYPNFTPSNGDYLRTIPADDAAQEDATDCGCETNWTNDFPSQRRDSGTTLDEAELRRRRVSHAPPGPCYAGLRNNVSTRLMRTSLSAWPDGTGEFVSQRTLEAYIQSIAANQEVDKVTVFDTRVEDVRKSEYDRVWTVRTSTLDKAGNASERSWEFEAVVVASGHYNMPKIPDIPGLSEAKRRWPERISHSKSYRRPEVYRDKAVLLIGAGVSSTDIARELGPYAWRTYQSSRGGVLDLPLSMLPDTALRVPGVASLKIDSTSRQDHTESGPLPIKVDLTDGSALCKIDHIIVATGYVTSYPFLSQYHEDNVPAAKAGPSTLVTAEGDMVHNLHKDIFFIADPSLCFVGAPYHVATFSLFDFQAQIIARVLSGETKLPKENDMREEYKEKVGNRGLGRDFHSLRGQGEEPAYVTDLVKWVNGSRGKKIMLGHTEDWRIAYREQREKIEKLRGPREIGQARIEGQWDGALAAAGVGC